MNIEELRRIWREEEKTAHIRGWDFSHISGRYEEDSLPWDYEEEVRKHLNRNMDILDYDTGGGEFLLSLGHPHNRTSATEGYPPNVELCRRELLPLGIRFKPCSDPSEIPFGNESFDRILNRHGSFDPGELYRLLRKGGIFITEQVGEDNERDLAGLVLPGTEKPFPGLNLSKQRKHFEEAGFRILKAEETYRKVRFYDVGAFVWFAHIIEWEFQGFSVDRCFEQLLTMQETIEKDGEVIGTTHRYLIIAEK